MPPIIMEVSARDTPPGFDTPPRLAAHDPPPPGEVSARDILPGFGAAARLDEGCGEGGRLCPC